MAPTNTATAPKVRSQRGLAREPTLAEKIRASLEDLIVSGTLKPGTRLDEAELAARFEVSRTPVREALKALNGTGLVELRGLQGVCVARISISTLVEMFQVMAVLEGLCAKYAARRATEEQKAVLLRLHGDLKDNLATGDHARFYEVNQDFHDALYEASNTQYLAEQTRELRKRVQVYRRQVTFQPGRMAATIGEHEAILDAIRRYDPDAAFAASVEHVSLLEHDIVDLIAAISNEESGSPR